jgi:hypothetical protein
MAIEAAFFADLISSPQFVGRRISRVKKRVKCGKFGDTHEIQENFDHVTKFLVEHFTKLGLSLISYATWNMEQS